MKRYQVTISPIYNKPKVIASFSTIQAAARHIDKLVEKDPKLMEPIIVDTGVSPPEKHSFPKGFYS
jgi:hypothetical protein